MGHTAQDIGQWTGPGRFGAEDLRADARLALRTILQERGALPPESPRPVPVQIVTPHNIPA